ncbi:hypothetical protein EVAR_49175_1 [Eumeta japonica]|uniref:Uncharacterized protein n=1 Tax=Eumeta variegata TaxID=151549 RepID=A0A4C1YHW9_EUMVA|nr:hypothetical protein EVAR_49175_1 [Eumeta japonica]
MRVVARRQLCSPPFTDSAAPARPHLILTAAAPNSRLGVTRARQNITIFVFLIACHNILMAAVTHGRMVVGRDFADCTIRLDTPKCSFTAFVLHRIEFVVKKIMATNKPPEGALRECSDRCGPRECNLRCGAPAAIPSFASVFFSRNRILQLYCNAITHSA